MAFFSDLLNPDKLKKKAVSTAKKASTYIAEDAKKKEAKKAADFKALTSSVKSGAKTVYEAYKPVSVPTTPLPKLEAEKIAAQVKTQAAARDKIKDFGSKLQALNETPEMQAAIQKNKLINIQNQYMSVPKPSVPLPYAQAAKSPEFRGAVSTLNAPSTISKITPDNQRRLDQKIAQEDAESIRVGNLNKDKFVDKKLQGLLFQQNMTGNYLKKTPTISQLRKENPGLVTQYSKDYEKSKRVIDFTARAGDVFMNDFKKLVGDKKFEEIETTAAWNPARMVPKMMSSAVFDVVDFEDLLQAGQAIKIRDGQLWMNGEPIGEEFTTEKGKKSAKIADVTAALLGSAPTYVGLSKGLTKLITKGAASKIPTAQKFFQGVQNVQARYPVLSEIALINPVEEAVEAGIRKGTGQNYTFSDFVAGLGIGAMMGGVVGIAGKQFKPEQIEKVLDQAEKVAAKTGDINQVMAIPFGGTNLGTLYKENRFAFNKQVIPGQRPGIEVAAPLPKLDSEVGEIKSGLQALKEEAKGYKSADEFIKAQSEIYHGTDKVFDEFDVDKTMDGTVWFTSSKERIESGEVGASGAGRIMNRFVRENDLKLATWDDIDKYSIEELKNQGFDGVKMVEPDEVTFQIFYPEKLLKDSDLVKIWNEANLSKSPLKPDNLAFLRGHKKTPRAGIDAPAPLPKLETKPEVMPWDEAAQAKPKVADVGSSIEAEAKIRDVYKNAGQDAEYPEMTKADKALYEVYEELEMSQAGKRTRTTEGDFIAEPSTFPDWLPAPYRSKELFNKVTQGLELDNLKYPPASAPKQRALYDLILSRIDSKLGVDTSMYRNFIQNNNEPKVKPAATSPSGGAGRSFKRSVGRKHQGGTPFPNMKPKKTPSIESIQKKLPQYPYITKPVDTKAGKVQLAQLKKIEKVQDKQVSNIVLPVEEALGAKQAQQYRVQTKLAMVAKKFKDRGIGKDDSSDIEAIFNNIEQRTKYPLPQSLVKKGVDEELVNELRDLQKFLTKEQTDRNLLERTLDPESYIKTQLIQFDGSPLTKRQVAQLQADLSKDFWKKLSAIQSKGGGGSGGKFSVKKGGTIERKYENADARDEALAKFGVKTNRNIFEVLASQAKEVSTKTASSDFIKSLRESARSGAKEVIEIFDPEAIKNFRLELKADLKMKREEILDKMRKNKSLSESQYKQALAKTKDVFQKVKADVRADIDTPKDIQKDLIDGFDQEFANIKSEIVDLMGENKGISNFTTLKEIDKIKAQYQARLDKEFKGIVEKEMNVPDDYVSVSMGANPALAQALRGLRFTKQQAKAIEKVFKTLDPNSWEDFVIGMKAAVATGDLFQLAEVARQSFATQGFKGLNFKKIMKYDPDEFLDRAVEATKAGVLVGKPSDIATDFSNNLGRIVDDLDKSLIARSFDKTIEGAEKIPGFKKVKEMTAEGFAKLERLQWETVVPRFKVAVFENSWPQFKKKYPKLSDLEAKSMAADFVNNTFQGINWDRVMSRNSVFGRNLNKSVMRASRMLLFGPDRLGSVLFRYAKAFGPYGSPYRKFAIRSSISAMVMLQLMNYAFTGHSTAENVKGNEFELQIPQIRDDKGNPMSMNLLGTWADPFKFGWNPAKFLKNKKSLLLGTVESLAGGPFAPETIREAMWENAPLPIAVSGLLDPFVQPLLGKKETGKAKTGETSFGVNVGTTALDFAGLPTTFRSGASKQATLKDFVKGDASFFDYVTSKELTGSKSVEKRVDKMVKVSESPQQLKEAFKDELKKMKENGATEDEMEKFAESALAQLEKNQQVKNLKDDSIPLKELTPKEVVIKKEKDIKIIADKFASGDKEKGKELFSSLAGDLTPEQQDAIAEEILKKAGL